MFSHRLDQMCQRSKVSKIALWRCSLNVFVIVFVFCICLRRCLFVGQVMFSHHSDHMSQRSKVSKIALWRYSLNIIVIVIVFVFAFVFVVMFLFVRSCFFMTPISFARFRFGLKGFESITANMHNNDKGRHRAARAAKNDARRFLNFLWFWFCY